MTTYYADFDLVTGDNDGTTQANAWQTHQRAIDGTDGTAPAAGDIVLSKGTDTLSARIDQDQNSGDGTSGKIVYRGVNSSWVNDGTRATIDGNNGSIDLMYINGPDMIRYENFVFKNTNGSGNDGVTSQSYAVSSSWSFVNCVFNDCDDLVNFGSSSMKDTFFFRCQFINSAANGVLLGNSGNAGAIFVGCYFDNITSNALYSGSGPEIILIDCILTDITGNAIHIPSYGAHAGIIHNCTIDGAADGIQAGNAMKVIGSRITNCTVGIDSDHATELLYSYMPNTGEDRANTTKTTGNVDEIYIDGSNSNNLSGTDTDGGYADPTTGDFNLDESKASQYNQDVDLET